MTILSSLIPIFGIIFVGAVIQRARLLHGNTAQCLNQFVYWISLPAMLFTQMAGCDSRSFSGEIIAGTFAGLAASFIAAYIAARAGMRRGGKESIVLGLLGSFPNYGYMGLSVIILLLPGDEFALATAIVITVIGNATFIFVDVLLELLREGKGRTGAVRGVFAASAKNPVLLSALCGILISVSGIPFPKTCMAALSMLAATAAPCALFSIGMSLHMQLASASGGYLARLANHLPVHLAKFVAQPLLTYVCLAAFGVSGMALNVGVLVSAMPAGVSCILLSEKYNVAVEDTPVIIFMSTAFSLFTISLTALALHAVNGFGA
ncbi:MAG: AEC family transporter [Desulfovibrio sp.]|jgi:predicted permease|nr:AEC family transporter [Desulfovibrio sp.]